jgi:DNA transposition AAA+ family ATPase
MRVLPLINALQLEDAIEVKSKSADEAKMIAFVGESGIGKTNAALYCAAHAGAVVVPPPIVPREAALLSLLLEKLGLYDSQNGKYTNGRRCPSVQDRYQMVVAALRERACPLIIDEAGTLSDGQLSMMRKLADAAATVVVLIGETGKNSRRCDDLLVKMGGIYNLQRRCAVLEASLVKTGDIQAICKAAGLDVTAEMAKYIATVSRTPSFASRILEKVSPEANITVAMIDQIVKELR